MLRFLLRFCRFNVFDTVQAYIGTVLCHQEMFPHYPKLNWFPYSLTCYRRLVNLKEETFLDGIGRYLYQPSVSFSVSFGEYLSHKQENNVPDRAQWDYGYIEYFRKALAFLTDSDEISELLDLIKIHEAHRDYYTASLRHINHLVQIDEKPNLDLKEPRCEIYKISLSFQRKSKS